MNANLTRLGLIDESDIFLDEAALALAALDHPDVDLDPYHRILDKIETRLDAIGHDAMTALARADVLSDVLSGEFGFSGDQETYDDPANADLIRVIDRRRGLPVSLSILYVAAARRLGWDADLLDIPGHVLVLIGRETVPVVVDPFRGGIIVPGDRLAVMLTAGASSNAAARHVAAMPNRAILVRLLLNQATRAEEARKGRRALELYRRMTIIAPEHGHAWWERARLELTDHNIDGARASLTAMLEVTRDPTMRRRIGETIEELVAS